MAFAEGSADGSVAVAAVAAGCRERLAFAAPAAVARH
jgi:hypothetical protein